MTRISWQDNTVWFIAAAGIAALSIMAVWQRLQDHGVGNTPAHPVAAEVSAVRTPVSASPPVRVEVLNGCGAPQAAAHLTRRARRLGLDVVKEGNAENFSFMESMVIDRRGDLDTACRVARKLGIPVCIQQISQNPSMLADVTIIIGHDHKRLSLLAP